jgi:Carboxypeptidase regulatory-like domain
MLREVILKKTLAVAAIFAMSVAILSASALASPPYGAPYYGAPYKDKEPQSKVLLGKVLDAGDNPLAGAVVYLTNTRTRAVKTYIAGKDGDYRFPGLTENTDYEVYAQFQGHKSDTKSLSQFDSRATVSVNLKIDAK